MDQLWSDDIEVTSIGPGENVKVKLKNIEEEDVSPGFVLCDPNEPIITGRVSVHSNLNLTFDLAPCTHLVSQNAASGGSRNIIYRTAPHATLPQPPITMVQCQP